MCKQFDRTANLCNEETDRPEKVQKKTIKAIRALEQMIYKERLKKLGLFNSEKGKLRKLPNRMIIERVEADSVQGCIVEGQEARAGCSGGFCEKTPEAAPCQTEPASAASNTDLLLAKAEPISDIGSASVRVKKFLRGGERKMWHSSCERGVGICEKNNSTDTKVNEEGVGGGAPGARAGISLQPMMKTMVKHVVPLQIIEVNGGADIHLQPMEEPMPEQVGALERGRDPVGSPCWSRLLSGPVDTWGEEPKLEQ
ncbi:hypothetical protein QYF61_023857, partial [Mycteria americana]